METQNITKISVETTIQAPIEKVWEFLTEPKHITHWYQASDDWHAPYAENDIRVNGKFKTTMAAKDGSFSFDFEGQYTDIVKFKLIEFTITDGRKVQITLSDTGNQIELKETFEAENINPVEHQKSGWQAILDNLKNYAEQN